MLPPASDNSKGGVSSGVGPAGHYPAWRRLSQPEQTSLSSFQGRSDAHTRRSPKILGYLDPLSWLIFPVVSILEIYTLRAIIITRTLSQPPSYSFDFFLIRTHATRPDCHRHFTVGVVGHQHSRPN